MIDELKRALSILTQKVNEMSNALKAKPDVYFGTVDSVSSNTANVVLDGDTQAVTTSSQCVCNPGDRVTVIRHGVSLVTVSVNQSNANEANAILNALGSGTGNVTLDDTLIITQNTNATEQKFYRRPVSKLWSYIKSKIDSTYGMGTRKTVDITSAVAVANASSATSGTGTEIGSVTLETGVWIVYGHLVYASNATGNRWGAISSTSGSVAPSADIPGSFRVRACSSAPTVMNAMTILNVTSESYTVYMNAAQNSGNSLNVTGCIRAVRIA